jgi:hypothetical protein
MHCRSTTHTRAHHLSWLQHAVPEHWRNGLWHCSQVLARRGLANTACPLDTHWHAGVCEKCMVNQSFELTFSFAGTRSLSGVEGVWNEICENPKSKAKKQKSAVKVMRVGDCLEYITHMLRTAPQGSAWYMIICAVRAGVCVLVGRRCVSGLSFALFCGGATKSLLSAWAGNGRHLHQRRVPSTPHQRAAEVRGPRSAPRPLPTPAPACCGASRPRCPAATACVGCGQFNQAARHTARRTARAYSRVPHGVGHASSRFAVSSLSLSLAVLTEVCCLRT